MERRERAERLIEMKEAETGERVCEEMEDNKI